MIKIQQRTKTPLIGSGKIMRRVEVLTIIRKPTRHNGFVKNLKFNDGLEKRIKIKRRRRQEEGELDFHNPKIKKIFLHWNTKGKPFTKHKVQNNKTVIDAIKKLDKYTKRHPYLDIIDAIDLCHMMFCSSWFKIRTDTLGIKNISLASFLKYNKDILSKIKIKNKKLAETGVRSWMKECLKGEEYLRRKYSFMKKEKDPELTDRLKSSWLKYTETISLTPQQSNQLITCCNKAIDFAELNEIEPMVIIEAIDSMLNEFKNFKPKHCGYLTNDIFWADQLPKELVRYGIFKELRGIQLLK